MKRVLLIHGGFLLPVHNGGTMRSWNFVQALRDRYELSLIYSHRPGQPFETESIDLAKQSFAEVWSVPIVPPPAPSSDTLLQRLMRKGAMVPWEIEYSYQPSFADALSRVVADRQYDFILARSIYQAQYVFGYAGRISSRIVIDLDDLEPRKIGRHLSVTRSERGYLDRWRTAANLWTFEQYHRRRLAAADTLIVGSEDDRRYVLAKNWTQRVAIVPNAIDTTRYAGACARNPSRTLLFCGTLSYEPNVDAIVWFAREVLPHLRTIYPDVKVLVVGHRPAAEVTALAADPSIAVIPDVPDIRPYYQQAEILVVPIRIAGGTRIKILEAGACRRPVVSTSVGAEGLDLIPGRHILIADDPIEFAERCAELLTNPGRSRDLANELHQVVVSKYDTAVMFDSIRRVFDGADDLSDAASRS